MYTHTYCVSLHRDPLYFGHNFSDCNENSLENSYLHNFEYFFVQKKVTAATKCSTWGSNLMKHRIHDAYTQSYKYT